jgi:glycosyltransferase involved in cell wall biosynthesis
MTHIIAGKDQADITDPSLFEEGALRVALTTGLCQPGGCGVGDYTACLAKALKAAGSESLVINSGDWSLGGVLRINRSLREQHFDIVHMQYPTAGFGTKLGPQGLSMLQRCVVTVHEVSQRHILRKLSLVPFAFRSKHIIFTSESERHFAMRWIPWVSRMSSVIPVGSNIPLSLTKRPRRLDEVVYFGLILPGKGLEQVLELSDLIKSSALPLKVRILGQAPARYAAYYRALRSQAADLPILWSLGLSDQEIARELSETSFCYLPYPDGASERRTTLKAALLNGVAVITTRGPHTPQGLENAVRFCHTPQEALDIICFLMNHREQMAKMTANAACSRFAPSWEHIAQQHLTVYQCVLSGEAGSQRVHRDNIESTCVNARSEMRKTQ